MDTITFKECLDYYKKIDDNKNEPIKKVELNQPLFGVETIKNVDILNLLSKSKTHF
jgi:hypothetical protein